MPSRNVMKIDIPQTYYHVYARGLDRQWIFMEDEDYAVFLNLMKRYLSPEPASDRYGRQFAHLHGKIQLLAYCIMPNHFHLLFYQVEAGAMQQLMRGVMTSYSRYFNDKYKRRGPLFESRYKASMITDESYLQHISRYIHLNPRHWQNYPYSSLACYMGMRTENWLEPELILANFEDRRRYLEFVSDYEDYQRVLEQIKHELAETY